ncbi:hypothetical protein, conserved [Eimeria brunetti]|uniref:SAG family member n=1 Tax=Eimeria brunetti TaxID=51314 RepID=U6LZP3_9EIME|nr:hypothetical protein, conserved [Eimeria brunetti]
MVSFCTTAAAVCLVALSGLQPGVAGSTTYKFTVESVTEDAYLAANLARNGKLRVHVNEVATEQNLVTALKAKLQQDDALTGGPCDQMKVNSVLKDMFYQSFDYPDSTTPDYRQLLQDALKAGLDVFKDSKYPQTDTAWGDVWGQDAGASLGYLLGSNSTQIGCVIGKCTTVEPNEEEPTSPIETPTEKAMLFCELSPAPVKGKAPFDEEYFSGLIARTTLLKDMTEDDLKAPAENSDASAVVPTTLIAGFAAMSAAVSV